MKTSSVISILGAGLFGLGVVSPALVRGPRVSRQREHPPSMSNEGISVVIPAYLEAGTIAGTCRRVQRQLRMSPITHSEVLVVASDSATAEAARDAADRVLEWPRNGKADAINFGVGKAAHELIVLTDGNCEILPDSWPSKVLSELDHADLVSGSKQERGSREVLYWAYERALKGRRFDRRSTLSVVGEFLAFRKSDFVGIPPSTLVDDLEIALDFASRGLEPYASPNILAIEAESSPSQQWERRVRIATGALEYAWINRKFLRSNPLGRAFLAHRIYRLTVGAAGFWIAVIALCVGGPWSRAIATISTVAIANLVSFTEAPAPPPFRSALSPLAMQSVPVASWIRAIIRSKSGRGGVWAKQAR